MKIIRFDLETATTITQYGSRNATFTRIGSGMPDAFMGWMRITPGGVVGYHPTLGDQLFLVVQGQGWAAGEDRIRTGITAGQAAFWRAGEWHMSGSETGMLAVVIEAEKIEMAE